MTRLDSAPPRTKRHSPTVIVPDQRLPCPCGVTRRTAETLRAHKWLAHGDQS